MHVGFLGSCPNGRASPKRCLNDRECAAYKPSTTCLCGLCCEVAARCPDGSSGSKHCCTDEECELSFSSNYGCYYGLCCWKSGSLSAASKRSHLPRLHCISNEECETFHSRDSACHDGDCMTIRNRYSLPCENSAQCRQAYGGEYSCQGSYCSRRVVLNVLSSDRHGSDCLTSANCEPSFVCDQGLCRSTSHLPNLPCGCQLKQRHQ
ncbi:unnamed protein product [Soboliphyme baturini]|uniref:Disintegrin domain-containing protein n=1 Tax=Soboliphyme baturini TaxID=241478 RepID=A0A183IYE9_9BILA|nr:unnamed protein product [Soboliphyme baturini]